MYDTLCALPLASDLFAQAIHPTEPLVSVGLASGHVQTFRLPPLGGGGGDDDDDDDDDDDHAPRNHRTGRGLIETQWRTKRHKGSCRTLAFDADGGRLFSAGTDGLVKGADAESGRVEVKIVVPARAGGDHDNDGQTADAPCLVSTAGPLLLLATDSSALHVYDVRTPRRPAQTHRPHVDYVSSLTPLLPSSSSSSSGRAAPHPHQVASTGGATLAVTDLRAARAAVVSRSQEQGDDELLCSALLEGGGLAVGGAAGALTVWARGRWADRAERVVVSRAGEGLDCVARVPGPGPGDAVAVGMADGRVRIVGLRRRGAGRVEGEVRHDEGGEGVVAVGFEVGGRMVSGGGAVVKIWGEFEPGREKKEEEEGGGDDDDDGADGVCDSSSSDDDEEEEEEEEEKELKKKKRKRKKGARGGDGAVDEAKERKRQAMSFKGLD